MEIRQPFQYTDSQVSNAQRNIVQLKEAAHSVGVSYPDM